MTPVFNQTVLLKSLLSKFVNILYITDSEIERIQDFILSRKPSVDSFADDSELYETLIYLKDLGEECNYDSIQELVAHFEKLDNNLTDLLEPFIADKLD